MVKTIAVCLVVLAASLPGSSYAFPGNVHVENSSGIEIVVETFNGDDPICLVHYNSWLLKRGEEKSVYCNFNGKNRCKILVSKNFDTSTKMCGSGVTNHSCGPNNVVHVNNHQYLKVEANSCEFPIADAEVRLTKQQLPIPGGGVSECLTLAQTGTLLQNSLAGLVWQGDGNLVVYSHSGPMWASGTQGNADRLCFQGDGNLVTYKNGLPTWSTGTVNSGQTLKLQVDCNLVIADSDGNYKWGDQALCR